MDNFNFLADKDYNNSENKKKRVLVTTITACLTDHTKCIQEYQDSLTGDYVIKCECPCHRIKVEK